MFKQGDQVWVPGTASAFERGLIASTTKSRKGETLYTIDVIPSNNVESDKNQPAAISRILLPASQLYLVDPTFVDQQSSPANRSGTSADTIRTSNDNAMLMVLNPANLLYNLYQRYLHGNIYVSLSSFLSNPSIGMTTKTLIDNPSSLICKCAWQTYTGYILTSINPRKQLPLYGNDFLRDYYGKSINELPPHIYAIGKNNYKCS